MLANSRISEMNRELYRNGMSAYLDVIDAERELYASQMQFVEIAVQQYVNYVRDCTRHWAADGSPCAAVGRIPISRYRKTAFFR